MSRFLSPAPGDNGWISRFERESSKDYKIAARSVRTKAERSVWRQLACWVRTFCDLTSPERRRTPEGESRDSGLASGRGPGRSSRRSACAARHVRALLSGGTPAATARERAAPVWMAARQFRSIDGEMPTSVATCINGRPLFSRSATASRLNSGENSRLVSVIQNTFPAQPSISKVSTKSRDNHRAMFRFRQTRIRRIEKGFTARPNADLFLPAIAASSTKSIAGRNWTMSYKGQLRVALLAAVVGGCVQSVRADDKITIGFVTHSQGDPFIQQIIDGAQAAADDAGVTLKVAQQSGSAPDGQLKLVQNIVNAGAQGVATSVPGEFHGGRAERHHRERRAGRAVQPAEHGREGALRRREVDRKRPHARQGGAGQARRRVGQGQGHPRQLLPRTDRARKPRQGRRGIAEGGARPERARPLRRQGQRGRQLQPLGAALRREPGRDRARRALRAGCREPRQAECGERRQVHRPAATT